MATRLFMVTAAGGEQRFRGREQVCRPRAVEDGVNEQIKASTWRTERGLSGREKREEWGGEGERRWRARCARHAASTGVAVGNAARPRSLFFAQRMRPKPARAYDLARQSATSLTIRLKT